MHAITRRRASWRMRNAQSFGATHHADVCSSSSMWELVTSDKVTHRRCTLLSTCRLCAL